MTSYDIKHIFLFNFMLNEYTSFYTKFIWNVSWPDMYIYHVPLIKDNADMQLVIPVDL